MLRTLRFFANSPQGPEPDATGYKGFYYHFLDMESGRRVWNCELSTIDSAFLFAGMLATASYFDGDDPVEYEIRTLAHQLYERADWNWARNGGAAVTHGWRPENGFIPYCWTGYDEALLLYVLGLGSPTYPLPEESYPAYTSTYHWKEIYDYEYLYSGPLFTHQLSHLWIDFRAIQDAFMRDHGIDYFENSRQRDLRAAAVRDPEPDAVRRLRRELLGDNGEQRPGVVHVQRFMVSSGSSSTTSPGVPYGPDDGTIAPWAVVGSLPFAPEIVLPTIKYFEGLDLGMDGSVRIQGDVQPYRARKSMVARAGCRPTTSGSTRDRSP